MHIFAKNFLSFYFFYFQLILTNLDNVLVLAQVCVNERISLAKALLMVFRHEKQEAVLLEALNNIEINKEGKLLACHLQILPFFYLFLYFSYLDSYI